MDCLTLMAMRELRKRGTPFSPSGTLARMSWALRDRANWIGAQADLLPMRLAAAIAARLRGQSATMTEEQRNRALDDIEALVQKVADDMGRPHPAGALDGIAAAAYRVAAKRVARERRS